MLLTERLASVESFEALSLDDRKELFSQLSLACKPASADCDPENCSYFLHQIQGLRVEPKDVSEKRTTASFLPSWLDQPLTCEAFLTQVKTRYSALGKFTELSEEKRQEVTKVLDLACSERFSHCHFASCQNQAKSSPKATAQTSLSPEQALRLAKSQLMDVWRKTVDIRTKQAKELGDIESERNIRWTLLSNPKEKRQESATDSRPTAQTQISRTQVSSVGTQYARARFGSPAITLYREAGPAAQESSNSPTRAAQGRQ